MLFRKNILFNTLLFLNCLLVFLLLFEGRLSVPSWLQVFGRMHPLLVHFPIVLVLAYFTFLLFVRGEIRKESWYVSMMNILLYGAAIFAALTALMGLFLSKEPGYDADALALHKWMGIATSVGLFLLIAFAKTVGNASATKYIFVSAMSIIVILAGHFGANITHGENYILAPVTPEKKIIRAPFEEAFVFADVVQPILENKCISCHNSSKAKGELVMETKELLLKGGKDGKLWDTTKADLGLMMQRIHLSEEEKEHMPPSGKPQLTNEELEILYAWIKSGAAFDQKVIDLYPTDTLRAIAAKILKRSDEEEYDFAAADEGAIQKLSNDNRTITPIFINSPALVVNFFNKTFYTAESLKELKPLDKQIVEMNLDNMPVKDEDLNILGEFTALRKLNLNNSEITGKTLTALNKLISLRSISLSGTPINADQLKVITSLPQLRSIYIWNTEVTSDEIKNLEKQNENITYQAGFKGDTVTLKLTPPIIENEEQVIAGSVPLKLKHYIRGTIIRYTTDATEPDSLSSLVYDGKTTIDSDVTIKAKAYKQGWISSDILQYHFFKTTYRPDSIVLLTHTDKKYGGNGGKTIADLEKGDINNFGNGKWLGFRDNAMEVKMIFNQPVQASSLTISALKNVSSYIMPPAYIEVWGGNKEKELKLLDKMTPAQPTEADTQKEGFMNTENLVLKCSFKPEEIKYIKFLIKPVPKLPSWHPGKGQKGWVFIDEVFVN